MTIVTIHDDLMDNDDTINTNIYCCPIFITNMFGTLLGMDNGLSSENGAEPAIRSGTLTFVTHNGNIYGITCRHVLEALESSNLQRQNELLALYGSDVPIVEEGQMHFFFPKGNEQIHINAKFHKAPGDEYTNSYPDVAMARISPEKLAHIGRQSIPFDQQIPDSTHWSKTACGIATGYPEQNRRIIPGDDRLATMVVATVNVVAPIEIASQNKLLMFSELSEEPAADNLSGMSVGPILWSDESGWGLIGIVKKGRDIKQGSALNSESFIGGHAIWIDGEPINIDIFDQWVSEIPNHEPQIRDMSRTITVGPKITVIS